MTGPLFTLTEHRKGTAAAAAASTAFQNVKVAIGGGTLAPRFAFSSAQVGTVEFAMLRFILPSHCLLFLLGAPWLHLLCRSVTALCSWCRALKSLDIKSKNIGVDKKSNKIDYFFLLNSYSTKPIATTTTELMHTLYQLCFQDSLVACQISYSELPKLSASTKKWVFSLGKAWQRISTVKCIDILCIS